MISRSTCSVCGSSDNGACCMYRSTGERVYTLEVAAFVFCGKCCHMEAANQAWIRQYHAPELVVREGL